ncbi:hypothetical protein Baya_12379 [Bagarius yarrelli]|uniref:Uncharacterized protein n=1 Tax=Bagarius yarrelli TaxID=175774 RepID=A0A556V2I3_BAGYA|nr:hypothetical protein Baya_12379 [Bagarius yarrelli]
MAVRRMNEICPKLALTLVFSVLLFHACHGQTDSTATAAPSSQTTVMDDSMSTQKSPEGLTDLSTTNPTNRPATDINQVAYLPDATTPIAPSDITDIQAHTMLATFETTTPQPDEAQSPKNLNEETVHQDLRKHTAVETERDTGFSYADACVCAFTSEWVDPCCFAGGIIRMEEPLSHKDQRHETEESYMADKENQGNTLVSVAPLNPPEDQEKPSLNGESLEAVKTQNPPTATNGHSTAKADTEL